MKTKSLKSPLVSGIGGATLILAQCLCFSYTFTLGGSLLDVLALVAATAYVPFIIGGTAAALSRFVPAHRRVARVFALSYFALLISLIGAIWITGTFFLTDNPQILGIEISGRFLFSGLTILLGEFVILAIIGFPVLFRNMRH